jgi:phosphopentomutase
MKRVFLVVLDSVGIGALPDALRFGDAGADTLKSCFNTGKLNIPNLISLGLGNIEGLSYLGRTDSPRASYGRCAELSAGKDTTVGHWEIAGVVSNSPLPTYPDGFPQSLIDEFSRRCGYGVLCNKPYSGTQVICDYGEEHLKSGKLIVYTSADSVFQIAAHEDIVPTDELYRVCKIARELLIGEHSVGRVIARPFAGNVGNFYRTKNRHDFSLEPHGTTMLDILSKQGLDTISVGKISDIFASRGISESYPTSSNADGISRLKALTERDFHGLCFVNLVDFDMVYGHRNNAEGYAEALSEFDSALPNIMAKISRDDLLIITADHGCDPGDTSTDHTREYVPLLVYSPEVKCRSLGTRVGFCDTAKSVLHALGVSEEIQASSYYEDII